MKVVYLIFLIIASLILLGLFLYLIIGYLYYKNFFTKKGKIKKGLERQFSTEENDLNYLQSMEKITLNLKDDLKLEGFYRNDENSKLVVIINSYLQTKDQISSFGKIFQSLGFDQLLIDIQTLEDYEQTNLDQYYIHCLELWIEKAISLKNYCEIILFGLGTGGAISSFLSKSNLWVIKAIICDSCFDNALKQISYINSKKKIKSKLFFKIFLNYMKKNKNINLKNIDICENFKKSKIPVLILHGENDSITPVEMAYNLYASLPENLRQINVFKNAGHLESLLSDKLLYKSEIKKFLIKYNL